MKHITTAITILIALFAVSTAAANYSSDAIRYKQSGVCPGFRSRLETGDTGRVTPGSPNNVRRWTTVRAKKIGQIPGGETFEILDGPRCGDGITWWKVDYEGLIGCTGEGEGNNYWLEPYTEAVVSPESSQNTNENLAGSNVHRRTPPDALRAIGFGGAGGASGREDYPICPAGKHFDDKQYIGTYYKEKQVLVVHSFEPIESLRNWGNG